jgi:UDP-glucuronate 4-epimerase
MQEIDKTKKYLVTGAAGFIGFHLCKSLLEQGCFVIGFDNLNDYYSIKLKNDRLAVLECFKSFIFVKGDISQEGDIEQVFCKYRPDYVINLAAQAGVRYSIENPKAYINSNTIGFFNVLESCRKFPVVHLVYASSSSVYGHNKKIPFSTKDMTDSPVSLYAATKKSDELFAYSYSNLFAMPITGLRFFTVYGPFGRPDMAYFSFTDKIVNNKPIQLFNNGNMYRDFTYVNDIISAILKIIPNPPKMDSDGVSHKVYNIGNNHTESLIHFVNVLEKTIGKKAIITYAPMQPGDVVETYADVTELIHDFGYKPNTTIDKGLSAFWGWYKVYFKVSLH